VSILDIYGKTYEDHVRNKRQKKDGTILMTGQTIEEAINNPYQRDAWEKNADRVKEQHFSKTLQGDNQGINTVIGFGRGLHESLAGLGALLPNDFMPGKGELFKDVFTYENLSKGKVPYKIDEQYLGEKLNRELTKADLDAAQKYVDEKGLAPGFGKGAAFVAEFFVGLKGAGKSARAKELLNKTNRTSAEDLELEKLVTMYAKPTQTSISKKITKSGENKQKTAGEDLLQLHLTKPIDETHLLKPSGEFRDIRFRTPNKEDKELLNLYRKVMNNEIKLPNNIRFDALNSSTSGFDNIGREARNTTIASLKKLNFFMKEKSKYKGLSEPEIKAVFEKELPRVLEDLAIINNKTGGVIYPSQVKYGNSIAAEVMEILKPKKIKLPVSGRTSMRKESQGLLKEDAPSSIAYLFKNINPEDIKKIKKLHKRYLNGRYMADETANDVAVLTRNPKLKKMITKDGKVPDLDELNEILFENYKTGTPGLTQGEASARISNIINYINGGDVILSSNYDKIYPFTVNFPRDKKLAKKLIKDLNEKANGSGWNSHYGRAERDVYVKQADNVLLRPYGTRKSIINHLAYNRYAKGEGVGDSVHELAGIRTTGKNNMDSYGNFVMILDKTINEKLAQVQGMLGKKNTSWLRGDITIDEYIDAHNKIVKNGKIEIDGKTIKATPYLAEIMKPSEVTTYYTKAERKLFKEKYGMDLVKEAKEAKYAYKIPRNADDSFTVLDDLAAKSNAGNAMGGNPIPRTYYADGDQDPDDPASDIYTGIAFPDFGSIKGAQDRIIETYKDSQLPETIESLNKNFAKPVQIKAENVLTESRKIMNKGDRPLELRPLQDGFELISDNPIVEAAIASPWTAYNALLNISGAMYNAVADKDIDVEKEFPYTFKMQKAITGGAGKTPDDQDYISFVDELNRAQETGMAKLSYSIVDLLASIPDLTIETELRDKIQKSYNRAVDSGELVTKPETFLGEIGSVMVEFGMPGAQVLKGVNFLRRAIKSSTGFNLFTRGSYATNRLLGTSKSTAAAITAGNVAKRVGVGSMVFAGTDFIAGGPYNTVTEMMPDDPLFFDQTVGYDYIDTEGLSGRDLTVANFKNRLRFAADGAIVGGLFPLVGPALWQATKYGAIKPGAYVLGKGAKIADTLAVKPASYLASGKIKVPFTKPGTYEATIPGVQTLSQGLGGGAKIFGDFLGSDILARLAVKGVSLGSVGLKAARETLSPKSVGFQGFDPVAETGIIKQLPDFKDWRMFDVTDSDPLKANLKKIDNVFSIFRDVGKKSSNQYYVETKAQQKIKGVNREVEKYIDAIEQKAFDLAKGFENRYNTNKTSPAGEEYLVEQVLSAIKGQIKITDLPKELQTLTKELDKLLDKIKLDYADILPDGGLKDYIGQNLKEYLRQSFATFTNPQYRPSTQVFDNAVEFIADIVRKNENLLEEAQRTNVNTNEAVRIYATKIVEDILSVGKTDGKDPLMQLSFIAKRKLQDDDLSASIKTGEELPDVIKQLLGEENSLRSAVMQTTSSLVTQTQNLKAYNRVADILLKEGRLFNSAEEAIGANVRNALPVSRVPGIGLLDAKINQLYGSPEIIRALQSSAGPLDKLAQNEIIQLLIAYKAGVQTAKTVLSPATQSRNFGSATAFVLNNGWIGGRASVTDSFKIVLDDIFGAGRTANEEDLIKYISRQTELGVIDENIVASELTAVLNDIKSGKISTTAGLIDKIDSTNFMKTATRLYAGGDNVWKLYSHEYLKSMFKGAFKDIDEVKRNVKIDFGIDEFNPATMAEAIEEYAALTVRELMPTYSKVPPAIQAIRKIPFIGNFVSFPAEILRTSVATSSLALKHIASDNQVLRELGYRSLLGQAVTLYGINEGAKGLAHAMTDISPNMIQTYKDYFGPEYMKYSELVPISNMDEKGAFKVFDMSRYNPYDLVTATAQNLIRRATNPQSTLDPDKIETDVLQEYLKVFGPLPGLLSGTFFGLSISTESFMEAVTGNKKQGGKVYGDKDTIIEKLDKSFMHWANKIEPGAVSSIQKIYGAFAGDVDSQGVPLDLSDELFKLSGGSTVPINVPASFSFKISEFQDTFKDALVSESFYSTKNYQSRGPAQLVREYNKFNEEAFREQYKFYAAVRQALDSNLMTRSQIIRALKERKLSDKVVVNVLNGKFTPLSTREGGLKGRYNKITKGNPDQIFSRSDFMPMGALERAKNKWGRIKFEDFETKRKEPEQVSMAPVETPQVNQTAQAAPPVAPLPASGAVQVAETQPATGPVNEATGLTGNETALLNRDEQLIRQRQRGIV